MLGPGSHPPRSRPLAGLLLVVALLFAGCASSTPQVAPDTSAPSRPGGRVAAEPLDDRSRTVAGPSEVVSPAVFHALGSLAVLPQDSSVLTRIGLLTEDAVTMATLACTVGADDCAPEQLEGLDIGGVEVVNVATGAAGAGTLEEIEAAISSLTAAGVSAVGWGASRSEATAAVLVESGGQTVALHAISLAEDGLETSAHATEDSPGIAGPDAFLELLASMAESEESGHHTVVAVDWGDPERRSPDEAMVDLASALIRAGADVIVGSGSDFLNRLEVIEGVPVAFDLGSTATVAEDPLEQDTALLRVVFEPNLTHVCLLAASASPDGPTLDPTNDDPC